MWRDIALNNRQSMLEMLDSFQAELSRLQNALADGDGERLLDAFAAAKSARDAWLAKYGGDL
jgi:prephenate dehydrogenase